jgi:serine/threonine protein kinase
MRFLHPSARAAWVRCIAPSIQSWAGTLRSRFCPKLSRKTRIVWRGSSARRRLLAALNHPNIAAIYGVEEHALVMELVEGESPKGPMPLEDAWKIAMQIADALEYAHEKGIAHQDVSGHWDTFGPVKATGRSAERQ